jgi:hypothetical protein
VTRIESWRTEGSGLEKNEQKSTRLEKVGHKIAAALCKRKSLDENNTILNVLEIDQKAMSDEREWVKSTHTNPKPPIPLRTHGVCMAHYKK